MSDPQNFGFAKLVPGFDFLQNLAKGGADTLPQMPSLSNWVAPTLSVEELDKRIQELRAVHFWLEQNGKALAATIQALEVQKMTLATLQGMNYSMADLAQALKLKPDGASAAPKAQAEAAKAAPAPAAGAKAAGRSGTRGATKAAPAAAPGAVDPMAWWGSITQQFQQIAASAMQDAAQAGAAAAQQAKGAAKAAEEAGAGQRAAAPAKGRRKPAARRPAGPK